MYHFHRLKMEYWFSGWILIPIMFLLGSLQKQKLIIIFKVVIKRPQVDKYSKSWVKLLEWKTKFIIVEKITTSSMPRMQNLIVVEEQWQSQIPISWVNKRLLRWLSSQNQESNLYHRVKGLLVFYVALSSNSLISI